MLHVVIVGKDARQRVGVQRNGRFEKGGGRQAVEDQSVVTCNHLLRGRLFAMALRAVQCAVCHGSLLTVEKTLPYGRRVGVISTQADGRRKRRAKGCYRFTCRYYWVILSTELPAAEGTMAGSAALIDVLKRELKARGITYARVARDLGMSEASVKRMFSQKNFTLKRLDAMCRIAHIEFSELTRTLNREEAQISQLTHSRKRRSSPTKNCSWLRCVR
jgi:DNA-binding Xre family transcriptional regulator